jgi:uncharacterized protein (DUF2336 family)
LSDHRTRLTPFDVQRLAADHSADARIKMVSKLLHTAEMGLLAGSERALVDDLLLRLAQDAAVQVREAVAWQLYNSPFLSDDLAHALAMDVTSVAFPLLRHGRELTDDLLLAVIEQGRADKQLAIAAREDLPTIVADTLAEVGNLAVVATLAGNEGAALSSDALLSLADRFAHVPLVANPLAGRAVLPATVVERLVAGMSEQVRDLLVERHGLSSVIAAEVAARGRESVTLALLRPLARAAMDAEALAVHLHEQGRLGVALLLRALCAGDFDFFASGIAAKSRVKRANALAVMHSGKWEGLRALLDHAHIPRHLYLPFQVALRVARQLDYAGDAAGRELFQTEVLGRIFLECGQSEERAMDELLLQLFDQKGDSMIDAAMDLAGLPFIPLRGTVPRR